MKKILLFFLFSIYLFADFGTPTIEWSFHPGCPFWCIGCYILSTPSFADIIPTEPGSEVIVVWGSEFCGGKIYFLRGTNGTEIWSHNLISTQNYYPVSNPAIADLNNDGNAEILTADRESLYCFSSNGNVLWSKQFFWEGNGQLQSSPVIANVDTVGDAEIVFPANDTIFCLYSDGSVKWFYPILSRYYVAVSDIDEDSLPEVVFSIANGWSLTLRADNGILLWQCPTVAGTAPSIADIDNDNLPEIIVAGEDTIYCIENNGILKWKTQINEPGVKFNSQIAIADLDFHPDSLPEFVIYSYATQNIYCFRENAAGTGAELVWKQTAEDNVWGVSSPTPVICDIDGDNDRDVIWCGNYLSIYNGPDGNHPDNSGNPFYKNNDYQSYTQYEHPTVGDVDHDGIVEILSIHSVNGIAAISSSTWTNHRKLWSDYSYHITNIRDNLTCYRKELPHWKLHNTWLTQTKSDTVIIGINEKNIIKEIKIMAKPNPFVNFTNIECRIPITTEVSIKIYTMTGDFLCEVLNEILPQGSYSIKLNKKLLPGVYFCILKTTYGKKKLKLIAL